MAIGTNGAGQRSGEYGKSVPTRAGTQDPSGARPAERGLINPADALSEAHRVARAITPPTLPWKPILIHGLPGREDMCR